ncbi:MAG: preprotein translocase subunit SecG [Candidatus Dadabacteria bacterium]|nr:preprotein translocase subunit SecG [Candidatus Dadabacteria bacterium]MCY4046884.1 preprotein translocase subunit SecG [Candidatus Dadabacteria bacterium]
MEFLVPFIKTAHIAVAFIMIVIILMQPGGSDELGTVFGGGGTSESVFGAGGATTFLSKATRFMAVVFVATSLLLGYISIRQSSSSVFDSGGVPAGTEIPAEANAPGGAEVPDETPAPDSSGGE